MSIFDDALANLAIEVKKEVAAQVNAAPFNLTIDGKVTEVLGNGYYKVTFRGGTYKAYDEYNQSFSVDDIVQVEVQENDYSRIRILLKKEPLLKSGGTMTGVLQANAGIILPNTVPLRQRLNDDSTCISLSRNQYNAIIVGEWDRTEQQHAFLCVGTGGIAYMREPGASRKIWHEGNLPVEYGTWTPTLRGSTTAGTYTYSTRAGFYYRIGRYIYVTCRIQLSGVTTAGAGDMQVTGLPFTTMNVSGAFWSGPAVLAGISGWTQNYVSAFIDTNTSYVRFYGSSSQSGGSGFIAVTTAGSGDVINFSIGYLTN